MDALTRRTFCAHACQAASLFAAGVVAACGGGGSSPTSPSTSAPALSTVAGTVSGRTIAITIGSGSPLSSVGSAATVQTSLGTYLIARTGDTTFNAFTSTCTHEACTITGFESSQFVCPCHGSRYTTGGAVALGPATRSLTQYATAFDSRVLTLSV